MTGASVWWLFAAMAAITVALRASFIVLQDRVRVPEALRRGLAYVPAAVLAAIVFPAFVSVGDGVGPFEQAPRWAAGLLGALVGLTTRNLLAVVVAGMLTFWGVRALLG